MTSNIIYIVALGVGFKCPRKIHLNTQEGVTVNAFLRAYCCPFNHNSDGPVPAYCLVVLIFHMRRPHAGCNNQKPSQGG